MTHEVRLGQDHWHAVARGGCAAYPPHLHQGDGVVVFSEPVDVSTTTASENGARPDAPPMDGDRFVPYSEAPERHVYATGGIKDNVGKSRLELIPRNALMAAGDVLAYGARKYRPGNWRYGLPWGDTFASLQRHLWAWNDGEDLDPETGKSHLAHALCQLMFLNEYEITGTGTDDRWRPVEKETP